MDACVKEVEVSFQTKTNGESYWSDSIKEVTITKFSADFFYGKKNSNGSLCVYFDTGTWSTLVDGLIYTDKGWIVDFQNRLMETYGFSENAVNDVDYSEQGLQGYDFVNLDFGPEFGKEFARVFGL